MTKKKYRKTIKNQKSLCCSDPSQHSINQMVLGRNRHKLPKGTTVL